MSEYENSTIRPDARLIILKALAAQPDFRMHSGYISKELMRFGIDRPREWIHGELDWLEQMGAVTLTKAGSVVVAMITEKGQRHLRLSITIEGIDRPSLPGG
jgi:repressor of nif and glnA expression